MNFDEWLKQGLDDTPGGDWDETKVDEVVSAARKRRAAGGGAPTGGSGTGSVSRRRSAALRTATVAAAAVVVAAGVIGGIVWNGQHAAANKSPTKVHHSSGPNQMNQTSNNTKDQASSDTTSSLQMYGVGKITATKAIPWPGVPANTVAMSSQEAQVIQVPFTAAVATPTLTAPKSVEMSVPKYLAGKGKLVAYFVQMNQSTSFYLIGPPGMTGKAEMAGDGSFEVYLHNAQATLEVDTSGGSMPVADGMAAPFFPAAANAANSNVQGANWGPLSPATMTHPNPQTAYFAFQTKGGKDVAGWNDYLSGTNLPVSRMIYESNAKDWSYAPYILGSSVNLLNNILAPQIGGTPIKPPAKNVTVGGKKYSLQSVFGNYVATPAGVAYIMEPQLSRKGSPQDTAWADVPTARYNIAIASPPQTTNGTTTYSIAMPGTIPPFQVIDANNDVYYAYPSGLTIHNNRWITYSVAWAAPGMNRPESTDLHVFDVRSNKDTLVTSYMVGAGNYFSYGMSGGYLVYDNSHYVNNSTGATLVHQVTLYILSTGQKLQLPSTDVISDKSASSGFAVKFGMGGRVINIPLN